MRTRLTLWIALFLLSGAGACSRQTESGVEPAPDTDIYLVETLMDGGSMVLGDPVNVTRRPGYDNQPSFLHDGSGFLYSVIADQQADTYRYDIAAGESIRVTASTASEYSPTPMSDGESFSTVRLEAEFARLWRFPMNGRSPQLLVRDVVGLGYHTWIDDETVAFSINGDPSQLRLVNVTTGEERVVASDIGRCLQRVPGSSDLAYLDMSDSENWRIRYMNLTTGEHSLSIPARADSQDFAIRSDGSILMGDGPRLYRIQPGATDWELVADWSKQLEGRITRISISPTNEHMAIVVGAS
jgi:Tol biopolymer transport system component